MIHMSPDHGSIGTEITISGSALGTAGEVTFGQTVAQVSSWDGEQIVVTVPSNNAVTVSSRNPSLMPVWYRHDQRVSVTVTPRGAASSNVMMFKMESKSDDGHDDGRDGHDDGHDNGHHYGHADGGS